MAQAAVQLSSIDQLLAAAMGLPEVDRAALVRSLLGSLLPPAHDHASVERSAEPEPELTAELRRRREGYLAGEIDAVSLEELEQDLAGVLASVHR